MGTQTRFPTIGKCEVIMNSDEGDPEWPCFVPHCFGCGEKVGEDNDLPYKECKKCLTFCCEECGPVCSYCIVQQ